MKNGLAVILLLILLVLLFFSLTDHGHMRDWGTRIDHGCGGGYMWIILLPIIGVAVYLIWQNTKSKTENEKETAFDILKKRYARGEITKEQYEEMKQKLQE